MNIEFVQKVLRIFIPALAFMCCFNIYGMETREAHQFMFALSLMVVFGLLLRNIWLTLFLWLTIFLYSFFKFRLGEVYLMNIFYGCVLYYITKLSFKKEHIDYFINIILWVLFINLAYGAVQVFGYDFIYNRPETIPFIKNKEVAIPMGFMSNSAFTSCFIAFCLPLLASRKGWFATIAAFSLFPVLFVLHSSASMVAGTMGILFVLFFKLNRKIFYGITTVLLVVACLLLYTKMNRGKDQTNAGTERLSQWALVLHDSTLHPITGWGLDSFRKITEGKSHVYAWKVGESPGSEAKHMFSVAVWDNPHNLYISLVYEFGIFAWILLGGYLRQCALWFRASDKSRNVIALGAFMLTFFLVSFASFPIFVARLAVIIIPAFAMFEIATREV